MGGQCQTLAGDEGGGLAPARPDGRSGPPGRLPATVLTARQKYAQEHVQLLVTGYVQEHAQLDVHRYNYVQLPCG